MTVVIPNRRGRQDVISGPLQNRVDFGASSAGNSAEFPAVVEESNFELHFNCTGVAHPNAQAAGNVARDVLPNEWDVLKRAYAPRS